MVTRFIHSLSKSCLTKHKQTALNERMQAQHRSAATGLRSALGLGLALVALGLLHEVASSATFGGASWTSTGRRPDGVLVVVLSWLGMALAGWLALGSGLALLSTLPGSLGRWCARLADRLTPLLVRRVLTVALGTSTVSLALPPAGVVSTAAARTPASVAGESVTTPGFRPTRPPRAHDGAGTSLLAPAPRPGVAALDTVTVRRGDSLWSIAESHLGSAASDAEVARAWPRWFAANRAVIGDDPDLIHPGLHHVPPREGDSR